jgi:hypothetical protein
MHSKQTIEAISKLIQDAAFRYPPGEIRSVIEGLAAEVAAELSGRDEVAISFGEFISFSDVERLRVRDNYFIYFDTDDFYSSDKPKRFLRCKSRQELEYLDSQLGGDWWRLLAEDKHDWLLDHG